MPELIYIVGAGGLGREIEALLESLPQWKVGGYYDDGIPKGSNVGKVAVLGSVAELMQIKELVHVVVAIGDPNVKQNVVERLSAGNIHFPVLIHPNAIILNRSRVVFGKGSVITAGVVLTTDIEIGEHVLINLNATIGHDCRIGNFCSIMPGANLAGNVFLSSGVLVGTGSSVLNGIEVGSNAILGAGAVATRNIEANSVAMGIPARSTLRQ